METRINTPRAWQEVIEPAAWIVEHDGRGYGKRRNLTFKDASSPGFWIDGEVPEGFSITPLYTTPPSDEARRLLADFGARVLKHVFQNGPEDIDAGDLADILFASKIYEPWTYHYDENDGFGCGFDECLCSPEPDGVAHCSRVNPAIDDYLAQTARRYTSRRKAGTVKSRNVGDCQP